MCGIAGYFASSPRFDLRAAATRMQDRLVHRGPDAGGRFDNEDGTVSLAMRRLSIVDLMTGYQPLYNEARDLVLIANGEIYNYVELRAQLQAIGYQFSTGSDCEVILHLYEEMGLDLLDNLRGMFAFALYDMRRRKIILARDRMGEKPLYFHKANGAILFSSELKSLLRSGEIPLRLDAVQMYNYFHYGYVVDPATPIVGIRKLPAGSVMIADLESWTLTQRQWWRLEDTPPVEGDPVAKISEVLEEIGSLTIRADVDVGVALSGGLDSSLVAALAAKHHHGKVNAFTIGYKGRPPSDEREDARSVAQRLGLAFHEIELDEKAMIDSFDRLNGMRDDPIADIAGWGYYQVMAAARSANVPVMMQGQGGDELFWGYGWVREAALENEERQRRAAGRATYCRPSLPSGISPRSLATWLKDGFGIRSGLQRSRRLAEADPRYATFLDDHPMFVDGDQMAYTASFRQQVALEGGADQVRSSWRWNLTEDDPAVTTTRLICDTYLRENGIAQADRLSMATSVEVRLPLLDYRLIETVIGLRKVHSDLHNPPKTWLRQVASLHLPDDVLSRPKRGFTPPTAAWHKALFQHYGDLLVGGRCVSHGILTEEGAMSLARGELKGSSPVPPSFKALVMECWLRAMEQEVDPHREVTAA